MSEPADQETLSLVGLLDQLVDPVEPAPISMLPQTGGWLFLALTVATGLGWALWSWRRKYLANMYRRQGLQALAASGDDPAQISAVIRRTALAAFPRDGVARLHGAAWLAFLDRTSGGTEFSDGPGQALVNDAYHPAREPTKGLSKAAVNWIKFHKARVRP